MTRTTRFLATHQRRPSGLILFDDTLCSGTIILGPMALTPPRKVGLFTAPRANTSTGGRSSLLGEHLGSGKEFFVALHAGSASAAKLLIHRALMTMSS